MYDKKSFAFAFHARIGFRDFFTDLRARHLRATQINDMQFFQFLQLAKSRIRDLRARKIQPQKFFHAREMRKSGIIDARIRQVQVYQFL